MLDLLKLTLYIHTLLACFYFVTHPLHTYTTCLFLLCLLVCFYFVAIITLTCLNHTYMYAFSCYSHTFTFCHSNKPWTTCSLFSHINFVTCASLSKTKFHSLYQRPKCLESTCFNLQHILSTQNCTTNCHTKLCGWVYCPFLCNSSHGYVSWVIFLHFCCQGFKGSRKENKIAVIVHVSNALGLDDT